MKTYGNVNEFIAQAQKDDGGYLRMPWASQFPNNRPEAPRGAFELKFNMPRREFCHHLERPCPVSALRT
jgi:hypothetical protein